MKLSKMYLRHKGIGGKVVIEDMQYLQKKISGKSVYSNLNALYIRKPKNHKMWNQY